MSTSALKAVATGQPDASKNPVQAFRGFLERQKGQIAAALPKHIPADRMIRLACTEFAKNPMLQECTPVSVFGALIQASQLGLEVGVLGQAYLIPFKKNTKDKNGQWSSTLECQFIPGYKGLIALARRSGEVTSIETNIVYERDTFSLKLGIDSNIAHEPYLDGERGRARLVYGVAKFKDGGHHLEWMTIGDVERIRQKSKSKDNGPWVTDYEQMVRKTLIRRMANYLPMSVELEAALQVDSAVTEGKGATIDADFVVTEQPEGPGVADPEPPAIEPPTYAEVADLIANADSLESLDFARSHIAKIEDETQQAELNAEAGKRLKDIKVGK